MAKSRHHFHPFRWLGLLILLAIIGGIIYLEQSGLLATADLVPPLPTTHDCTALEAEINKYDWDKDLALAVAKAESSCDTDSRGDEDLTYSDCAPEYQGTSECKTHQRTYGYSLGAFQVRILPGREKCDTLDVATNVSCAYEIYQERNRTFEPWSGFTTGKYQLYRWRTVKEAV